MKRLSSRTRLPIAVAAGLVMIGALAIEVAAAHGQRLLSLGVPAEARAATVPGGLGPAVGSFAAQVDLALIRSAPLRLEVPTPDGRVLVAERSGFEDRETAT